MVVLFGILNNKYIATQPPFLSSDYFDPRLLHDLANGLQKLQVVSAMVMVSLRFYHRTQPAWQITSVD
ncbi:hypothetical protein [Candidatus Villigracilis saccharophilus]|uniref:hypothetical protein n=1 Tax=Candidatus Villigracilis saccharophilus TaxID=3140684 RepID=UPI0031EE045D